MAALKRVAVDMLPVVRNLEAQGFTSKQAEAITAAITELSEAHLLVSKEEMQKEHFPSSRRTVNNPQSTFGKEYDGVRASDDRFQQLEKKFRDEVRRTNIVLDIFSTCCFVIFAVCVTSYIERRLV